MNASGRKEGAFSVQSVQNNNEAEIVRCTKCHRRIKLAESIAIGMGPRCAREDDKQLKFNTWGFGYAM